MQPKQARALPNSNPLLLAFDDTDSRLGGCTTYLAFHVLLALPEFALQGMPRLVRLNPNVPWKTRGNAAVVLPLVRPTGPSVRVGELRGLEILAFPDGEAIEPEAAQKILDLTWSVLNAKAEPEAQPAVAVFQELPPAVAYWTTVRQLVESAEASAGLQTLGVPFRHRENQPRALVGILGAAAWPGPPTSFEFIAYREPQRWGTPRAVAPEPLRSLDATGATFHTWDPTEDRVVCVPHGPDPVLIGLRGRDPDALQYAATRNLPWACQEPIDGWLLWATNQASGDQVSSISRLLEAPSMGTIELRASVSSLPESRAGGHRFITLRDSSGQGFQAAAFEPTKSLRDVVSQLRPGDQVTVVGAYGEGVVRLEKLRIDSLAQHEVKLENPACPTCGKRMKSAGSEQGYRCRDCGTKAGADAAEKQAEERSIALGWYEVPVMARRHLHRPANWT